VRPHGVVVGDPAANELPSQIEIDEQALVKKLVAHPAVEGFDAAVLHRLTRGDVMPFGAMNFCPAKDRVLGELGAPLSETIIAGLPRLTRSSVCSRATRLPEIEVSGIAAKHSCVTLSTMLRIWKCRPKAN
jgi:hypothetical protein